MESIVTYGPEVWDTTEYMRKRLRAKEVGYWGMWYGHILLDRVKIEEIGININYPIEAKRLRC